MKRFIIPFIFIIYFCLLTNSVFCQDSGQKPKILTDLTHAKKANISSTVSLLVPTFPKEIKELTADLIIYRWASKIVGLPSDVTNIDAIIDSLTKAVNNQNITWAKSYFTVSELRIYGNPLPKLDDPLFEKLSDIKSLIKLATEYRDSYPVESVNALNRCLEICNTLNFDLTRAIILKELADQYYYSMSNYRQAEIRYDRANWIFTAYGLIANGAVLYDDWGALNTEMGRYSDAAEHYEQAARMWVKLAEDSIVKNKYRDKAGRAFMRAGEAYKATGDFDKAMELMGNYGLNQVRLYAYPTKSYTFIIKSLLDVADFQRERKDFNKSIELLKEAKKACKYQDDLLLTAKTFSDLSNTYALKKDIVYATESAQRRFEALRQAATAGEFALKKLGVTTGLSVESITKMKIAAMKGPRAFAELGYNNKAITIGYWLAETMGKLKDTKSQLIALRSQANLLASQSKLKEAIEVRKKAADVALVIDKKQAGVEVLQELAQDYIDSGDIYQAINTYTQLSDITESLGNVRVQIKVRESRGMLYFDLKKYEEAAKDLQYAKIKYLTHAGDRWASAQVSLNLAKADTMLGKDDLAIDSLETAIDAIDSENNSESMSSGVSGERSGIIMDVYFALTQIYVKNKALDRAGLLVSKAKSHIWSLDFTDMLKKDSNPDVVKLAEIDASSQNEPGNTNGELPSRTVRIASSWVEYVQACWNLSKRYQANYNALPVNPMEFFRKKDLLPPDTTFIEYMLVDSTCYIFVCGNSNYYCYEIELQRTVITEQIRKLRRTIKNCEDSLASGIPIPAITDWRESSFVEIRQPLRSIFESLLEPVYDTLNNSSKLGFILPEELAGLPFHALITNDDDIPTFLINNHQVSYITDGMLDSFLYSKLPQIYPESDALAIFADPAENLPGAQKEAFDIRNKYSNARLYLGANANSAKFLNELKSASIIHIAAHNKIDPNPTAFELTLANSKVELSDLLSINTSNLKLVSLSACESASSSDPISSGSAKAAEVFSLMGVHSILGGLWKVPDDASSELMTLFYENIHEKMTPAEAIRRAQLSVIKSNKYAHPFYWACIAFYGDME